MKNVLSSDLEPLLRKHGLLTNAVAPDAIRMAPPLNITDADIDDVILRWRSAVAELETL